MRLIDADALELDSEWSEYMDGWTSYSQFQIDNAPTIDAEPKVNRAEILRLCNDIEDIVARIYNSDEEIMYNDLISICGKLKAIGKELGDAGTD